MNEQCVPLAPNTGIAPTDQSFSIAVAIAAVLALASLAVLIILNRKKLKKFMILPVALALSFSLLFTGATTYAQSANCEETPIVQAPVDGTIAALDDDVEPTLPTAENGYIYDRVLMAGIGAEEIGGFLSNVYDPNGAAYDQQTYAEVLSVNIISNDTQTGQAILDPASVDLDPNTPGVQQTYTRDGYTLIYTPSTDILTIGITDAPLVLNSIMPEAATVAPGMSVNDYNVLVNRALQERLIQQSFTYTIKDTTGTLSSTATIRVTVIGEAQLLFIN